MPPTDNAASSHSIAPGLSLLHAIARQNLTWAKALGEFCDNSIDKHARTIHLTFGPLKNGCPAFVEVTDDGDGCGNLLEMTTICKDDIPHTRPSGSIGRYQIGAKDAALWIGDVDAQWAVRSYHDGLYRSVNVEWRRLLPGWILPPDALRDATPSDGRGTIIRVTPCIRRMFDDDIPKILGYQYAPFIKRGGRIILKRSDGAAEDIEGWRLPDLQDGVIDERISVSDKTARVYVGMVRGGVANPKPGITYSFGKRVIKPASGKGCGDYTFARIAGFVELDDNWKLEKNKDGINDIEEDLLYQEVQRVAEPILRRAQSEHVTAENVDIESELTRRVNLHFFSLQKDRKARRGRGESHGTKKPTGGGSNHAGAENDQEGTTFPGRKTPGIKIEGIDLGEDDIRPGYCDDAGNVILNTSHSRVREWYRTRNLEVMEVLVAGLLSADNIEPSGTQRRLRFADDYEGRPEDKFNKLFGKILSVPIMFDGKVAAAA
jgi:hypothetical protein